MKTRMLAVGLAMALFAPVMKAQQGPPPEAKPIEKNATINQRRVEQQKRIGEGVENGSLTAGEASRLERQETRLNREVRNMKADGKFTPQERARVQRQQNALSRGIYKQKHDAQTQPPVTGRITARDRMQQKRIGEGIENGSLTPREASRLERQEANLNRREAHMAASGGKLTQGERNAINRQQNRESRRIYRQKHDAQHR